MLVVITVSIIATRHDSGEHLLVGEACKCVCVCVCVTLQTIQAV